MKQLPVTKAELTAAIEATKAVAEVIRQLGTVPAGHLYAPLMSVMSLEQFEVLIGMLVTAKLVQRDAHPLRWIGPVIPNS